MEDWINRVGGLSTYTGLPQIPRNDRKTFVFILSTIEVLSGSHKLPTYILPTYKSKMRLDFK